MTTGEDTAHLGEKAQIAVPAPRSGGVPWPGAATRLDVITATADDFGHIVHHVPAAVVRPRDTWEVACAVRQAATAGMAVRARGAGHSVAGQAQCEGGLVVDMTAMRDVTVGTGRVSAGAGARWSEVLAATTARGLTVPVLTDYLELTVGGTLSAGGIGGASHQYGPQVDHVLELEVVTAAGEVVICSPSSRAEVFSGALAAHGGGGIITGAVLPLGPAPERARTCKSPVDDLDSLIAMLTTGARERRFDFQQGQITRDEDGAWSFAEEAASFFRGPSMTDVLGIDLSETRIDEVSYTDFCQRMAPGVRLLAATGDWYRPHPWLSVFLPVEQTAQFVAHTLETLTPETLGPIPMLLYPLRRGPVPAPGLATPDGDEDGLFFSFSILRTTADGDAALKAALASNHALARAAVEAGGTVYGISATEAVIGCLPGPG